MLRVIKNHLTVLKLVAGGVVLYTVLLQIGLYRVQPSGTDTQILTQRSERVPEGVDQQERLAVSVSERIPLVVPQLVRKASAQGLSAPDGLDVDWATSDIYVTEEDRGRVIRFRNGRGKVIASSSTPIFAVDGSSEVPTSPLRSLEGLACGRNGRIYVTEDIPGGRLVCLALDETGMAIRGEEIDLPIDEQVYAWESVDVGPQGEILLAGSSLEYALTQNAPTTFDSVLLYRDATGRWWQPPRRSMSSISAARFNHDGSQAVFACEFSGEVGWLDLKTREGYGGFSRHTFLSPEGLCALPDGSYVVAQEGGSLVHLDPYRDEVRTMQSGLGTIESVCWDGKQQQLLVTADKCGTLLAFKTEEPIAEEKQQDLRPFESPETAEYPYVPETCPVYLKGALELAGFPEGIDETGRRFTRFARNSRLIAIDARASLVDESEEVDDPIEHVQFAIFEQSLFGLVEQSLFGTSTPSLSCPVSGFAVRHRSGRVQVTTLVSRKSLHMDLGSGLIRSIGKREVTVPYPGPTALVNGAAFASFMGLGRMPDFCFNINPHQADHSRMTVLNTDGTREHYALDVVPSEEGNREWIVAMEHQAPEAWAQLSGPEPDTSLQLASLAVPQI